MARLILTIVLGVFLAMPLPARIEAGGGNYERPRPPRISAVAPEATSFYIDIRAREEAGGFGHSNLALGTVNQSGHEQQTVLVGFVPRSADDDRWSRFAIPVTGSVGVTRSDFVQQPAARFRVTISKTNYFRAVNKIYSLRSTWKTYDLLVHNCNGFVGQIANSVGLRTPMMTAQLPIRYVAELRGLNSR